MDCFIALTTWERQLNNESYECEASTVLGDEGFEQSHKSY